MALGLVVGVPAGVVVCRRWTRIRDPRTGADMTPMSYRALTALIGLPLGLVLIAWVAIEIFGSQG